MKSTWSRNYRRFEKSLGIVFRNKRLLRTALTHSSSVQGKRKKSNETMEFLGDAVLELIVRLCLFKKFPRKSEGDLSQLKKAYTSEEALYRIGKKLQIGEYLIIDRGEELTGGRKRPSNISCGMEALIGAIFLDRGLNYAKRFVVRNIMNRRPVTIHDYKSLLNQWAMKVFKQVGYKVIKESGPHHARQFQVALMIDGKRTTWGAGKSKKCAEQDAARKYLRRRKGAKGKRGKEEK